MKLNWAHTIGLSKGALEGLKVHINHSTTVLQIDAKLKMYTELVALDSAGGSGKLDRIFNRFDLLQTVTILIL